MSQFTPEPESSNPEATNVMDETGPSKRLQFLTFPTRSLVLSELFVMLGLPTVCT